MCDSRDDEADQSSVIQETEGDVEGTDMVRQEHHLSVGTLSCPVV